MSKTETPEKPATKEEEEPQLDAYESMIQDRLSMLQEQYNQFEKPDYLSEDESKIVPFIMMTLSELFVRQDIMMDKIYAQDAANMPHIDEDLNIKD